jgi:hypothetical protein
MADCSDAINALVEAVEAIELELGVTPSTVYQNVRARLDILESRINNPFAPSPTTDNPFLIGTTGVTVTVGSGVPSALAQAGSLYLRDDGYFNQVIYTRGTDAAWQLITPNRFLSNTTINFGTVSATSTSTQTVTLTGAKVGENVVVNPRAALASSIQIDYCRVSATNTIEIRIYNRSGGGVAVNQAFDIIVFPNN